MFRNRVTSFIIESSNGPVESGHAFLQQLFKGIGNTELPVHKDLMPMPFSSTQWLHHFSVTSGRYRTQIMFIIKNILWGYLLG